MHRFNFSLKGLNCIFFKAFVIFIYFLGLIFAIFGGAKIHLRHISRLEYAAVSVTQIKIYLRLKKWPISNQQTTVQTDKETLKRFSTSSDQICSFSVKNQQSFLWTADLAKIYLKINFTIENFPCWKSKMLSMCGGDGGVGPPIVRVVTLIQCNTILLSKV